MKVLKITYPVITFNTIEVQVSDEKADDLVLHHNARVEFILQQIEQKQPHDIDWLPMKMSDALSDKFASIEIIE